MRFFKAIMNTKDEMLSAIRIVKFFGWESKFEEKITAARGGAAAHPGIIFTTLALFNIMRQALNVLPRHLRNTVQATVCLKCINKFLLEEELVKDTTITKNHGNEDSGTVEATEKRSWMQKIKPIFVKAPAPVTPQERLMLKNLTFSGSITIDRIVICKIGLQDLRSNLTVIPHDPILFKGTLRFNLDPFGQRTLGFGKFSVKGDIKANSSVASHHNSVGISTMGSNSPSSSSSSSSSSPKSPAGSVKDETGTQGLRQLIALARQSKVIVLDEATASVDCETDLEVQDTIRQEMASSTIITIADFNRVLVMNAGDVAEFDKPLTNMDES
ncbi:Multidrug resistance-associated protein 1, partial [Modicella reniformis]